jgi:hypothetical protein
MPKQYAEIHLKRERGKLVIVGLGQTGRGQKYPKGREVLPDAKMTDKKFKDDMKAAVGKLFE